MRRTASNGIQNPGQSKTQSTALLPIPKSKDAVAAPSPIILAMEKRRLSLVTSNFQSGSPSTLRACLEGGSPLCGSVSKGSPSIVHGLSAGSEKNRYFLAPSGPRPRKPNGLAQNPLIQTLLSGISPKTTESRLQRVNSSLQYRGQTDKSALQCLSGSILKPTQTSVTAQKPLQQYCGHPTFGMSGTPKSLAAEESWENFHSAIQKVKEKRDRLQKCIESLKKSEVALGRLTAEIPQLSRNRLKSAFLEPECSEKTQSPCTTHDRSTEANSSTPRSPQTLKHLLLTPIKSTIEMTVPEFRQLEQIRPNCTKSPKSCLKPQLSSRLCLKMPSEATSSESTLKRAVSFSENVVMFIYQA